MILGLMDFYMSQLPQLHHIWSSLTARRALKDCDHIPLWNLFILPVSFLPSIFLRLWSNPPHPIIQLRDIFLFFFSCSTQLSQLLLPAQQKKHWYPVSCDLQAAWKTPTHRAPQPLQHTPRAGLNELTQRFEDVCVGFIYVGLVLLRNVLGPFSLLFVAGLASVAPPPVVALGNVHANVHSVVTCHSTAQQRGHTSDYSHKTPEQCQSAAVPNG